MPSARNVPISCPKLNSITVNEGCKVSRAVRGGHARWRMTSRRPNITVRHSCRLVSHSNKTWGNKAKPSLNRKDTVGVYCSGRIHTSCIGCDATEFSSLACYCITNVREESVFMQVPPDVWAGDRSQLKRVSCTKRLPQRQDSPWSNGLGMSHRQARARGVSEARGAQTSVQCKIFIIDISRP